MTDDKGILIRNVYYMLTYAFQVLRQNNYDGIKTEKFDDIHDLFAEILSQGISNQLKQGLHREYIAINETLSTLRGKLNLNDTIRQRIGRRQQLACEYDEYSENCVFNQILKTTCHALIQHPDVKGERKQKLRRLMAYFCNVDLIDISTVKWSSLRFDRNTRTYQMLLYLCHFLQKSMLLTTEEGNYKVASFTDDNMNRLFEKFVLEYYRKKYSGLRAEAAQIDWNIDKRLSDMNILPIMQTDVMLHLKERTLIIDTKYYSKTMQQHFGKTTIHSHNLYQIQSYVYNLDREHTGKVDGMLLYAKTQEQIVPDGQMVLNDGNRIYYRTLDLNQEFGEIEKQLKDLIKN